MTVARRAPAKLNLALAVGRALPAGGPNPGMHPIASWMHAIDLHDDVEVAPLGQGPSRYSISWAPDALRPTPIDWPIDRDLAVRAHRLLERESGRPLPVSLTLRKRIPVGGGLGGGSSDAAAALLAIRDTFDLHLPPDRLAPLARELGSDVPFFLDPAPAIVEGLGERITWVHPQSADAVLIVPGFGCSTADVYRAFDLAPAPSFRNTEVRRLAAGKLDPAALFNDLTAAAIAVQPALGPLIRKVRSVLPHPVHMSGSGSTLFILPGPDSDHVLHKLRSEIPDVVAYRTRLT